MPSMALPVPGERRVKKSRSSAFISWCSPTSAAVARTERAQIEIEGQIQVDPSLVIDEGRELLILESELLGPGHVDAAPQQEVPARVLEQVVFEPETVATKLEPGIVQGRQVHVLGVGHTVGVVVEHVGP